MRELKKCEICRKEHRNKRFCSYKCANKVKSIERKLWLKTHEHPRGMLGKKQSIKSRKLSSERCKKRVGSKHPYWKGGSQVYWNSVAVKVMKEEPNICFYKDKNCKGIILVHHQDRNIRNNKKSNLIKVCSSHHKSICHRDMYAKTIKIMNKARLKKIKENPDWWRNRCEVKNGN